MVTSTSTPGSILMDVWTTVKEISLVLSTGDNFNQGEKQFHLLYLTGGNFY